jgi:hypothetical protein
MPVLILWALPKLNHFFISHRFVQTNDAQFERISVTERLATMRILRRSIRPSVTFLIHVQRTSGWELTSF